MTRWSTIFVILVVCGTLCAAKEPTDERWSDEVTAEVVLQGITDEQARDFCLKYAKVNAVRQVAGEKLLGETLVKDFVMLADLVLAESYGWVKDVKDVRWEQENLQERPDEPPRVLFRVRLKGLVVVDRNRDEGFALKVSLDRQSYEDGDEMQITVQAGQDAYLTIFNIREDDKVTVLLPNHFKWERMVNKDEKFRFPDPERMGSHHPKIKLFRSSKSATATEAILVVATKDDRDIIGGDFSEAAFREFPKQTGLFQNVLDKLMDIQPSKRAMAVQYYELRVKNVGS